MMIPDTVVGSAIGATAMAFVGVLGLVGARWRTNRNGRNGKGKNGGCPRSLQDLHGERLVRLETQMETTNATLERVEGTLTTILGRLPK